MKGSSLFFRLDLKERTTIGIQVGTGKVDEAKLNQFVGQMLSDLGGALSVALVRIGDRLGLYKALHADGPSTSHELASKNECGGTLCTGVAIPSGRFRLRLL